MISEDTPELLHKVCTQCLVEKPLEDFWRHKKMIAGRYSKCKECCSANNKKRYEENPKHFATHNKKQYLKNPEIRIEKQKEYYEKNSENVIKKVQNWVSNNQPKANKNWRSSALKRKYGITLEIYEELLNKQDRKCAVCGTPQENHKQNFHVDHAHTESEYVPAGMVRGLLCWNCNNRLIGKWTDPQLFEKAASYLKQHTHYMVPTDQIKPKRKRKRRNK